MNKWHHTSALAFACVLALFLPHLFCRDASALDENAIQELIDRAIRAGGGEVVILRGTHLMARGLKIRDAKRLRITGPRVKRVNVIRCAVRNCHGRGVAFYSVEGGRVEDCTFAELTDEVIDLDHFTVATAARRNRIDRSSGDGIRIGTQNPIDRLLPREACLEGESTPKTAQKKA